MRLLLPPDSIFAWLLLACATCTAPSVAGAQVTDLDPWRPAPGTDRYLTVEGARLPPHLEVSFSLEMSFAHRLVPDINVPLFEGGSVVGSPIHDRVTFVLGGTIGLWGRLALSFEMPTVIYQQGDEFSDPQAAEALPAVSDQGGLGDFGLAAKVLVVDADAMALSLALDVHLPTGRSYELFGDPGASFEPRLLTSFRAGELDAALEVGGVFRTEESRTIRGPLSHQLTLGLGARYEVVERVSIVLDAQGRLALESSERSYGTPVEIGAGGVFGLTKEWFAIAGVSTGVPLGDWRSDARPTYRVHAGLQFRSDFEQSTRAEAQEPVRPEAQQPVRPEARPEEQEEVPPRQ